MPHRRTLRPGLLLALLLLACEGELQTDEGDASTNPPDGGAEDAGALPGDAGALPGDSAVPLLDAGAPGPVTPGALAPDLRVTRIDLYQSVRVPLVAAGAPADRTGLPVVAGREAVVRVHVEALPGWTSRPVSAVLELDAAWSVRRFVDTRTPALPADDERPASLFAVSLPADALTPGAKLRLRLEASGGVASAPDATFPRDGSLLDLQVEPAASITLVLVPFRYDTDGSGRLPDTSEAQLARYRDELTSRFPYAEVDLRVHAVVPWSRSNRLGGNVDWGAVNNTLIGLRDAAGAASAEYWYGLMAPDTSRTAYCRRVIGSCVTGQSYVAGVSGTRVGSGLGFGDEDSVGTLAHELGHLHGRYHAPCGTSGTDSDYPYRGGVIGVRGWDRRDGTFHAPDAATDLLGYCDPQWISDYTYLAIFERQRALRTALSWRAPSLASAHRFITQEDGALSWSEPSALRRLPGEVVHAAWVDDAGHPLAWTDAGLLEPAHGDARVWVVPDATPPGARALRVGEHVLPLPPH
jgi:hypothetical protein